MTLVKYESELPLGGAVSKDGVNRVPGGCAGPWATTPTPAHTSSTAVASCPPSARSPPLRAQYRLAAITHSGALLRCQLALKGQYDLDPFHRVGRNMCGSYVQVCLDVYYMVSCVCTSGPLQGWHAARIMHTHLRGAWAPPSAE
jgi:hypothetical protein